MELLTPLALIPSRKIREERVVAFELQQWLRESTAMLLCDCLAKYVDVKQSGVSFFDQCRNPRLYYYYYYYYIFIITYLLTAIQLSLGGSSPYTGTEKTSTNKYT